MTTSPTTQQVALVQARFVQYAPQLRGFVVALMPDRTQIDDVMQETFLTITAKADVYDQQREFLAWACGIARFKIMEVGRRMTNRQSRPLSDSVLEALAASEPPVELDDEPLRALGDCLQTLAPHSRRMVELSYQQAHKPAEVAKHMEWTVDAVYVALSRARSVLRTCIEQKLGRTL